MSIRIGISKGSGTVKYANYPKWILNGMPDAHIIDLSISADPVGDVDTLSGIVFTGGPDLDPSRYGHPEDAGVCDIDEQRDVLEFKVMEAALASGIPVLGICRGAQLLNVFLGGTLTADIPTTYPGNASHGKVKGEDAIHHVDVDPGTLLHKAVADDGGIVNSSHHQAIDKLGDELRVSARSDDGIVEAIELVDPFSKPYLLGVQWHPERMGDQDSAFSKKIRDQFLFEVQSQVIAHARP